MRALSYTPINGSRIRSSVVREYSALEFALDECLQTLLLVSGHVSVLAYINRAIETDGPPSDMVSLSLRSVPVLPRRQLR